MSTTTLLVLGLGVAAIAAVRSTWSPCGWSMLSTITPLTERGRGHRHAVTGTWFLLGALLGGAALGGLGALGALVGGSRDLGAAWAGGIVAVAALGGAALDSDVVRPALPHHRRQVDEQWLDRFRPWVYGVGFGAQIGFGLATYIMTAGVYLVILLGALTGSPGSALAMGLVFGLVRGSAVFASARCTSFERLTAFHRAFADLATPVRLITISCLVAAATLAGSVTWGAVGGVACLAVGALWLVLAIRSGVDHISLPEARRAETRRPVAA